VTVTVANVSGEDREWTTPNPCVLGYRVDGPEGVSISTEEMPTVCVQMEGALRLRKGESQSGKLRWTGRNGPGRPLPPGRYLVSGTVSKRWLGREEIGPGRSAPVTVDLAAAR
jgi:hypothetical protein